MAEHQIQKNVEASVTQNVGQMNGPRAGHFSGEDFPCVRMGHLLAQVVSSTTASRACNEALNVVVTEFSHEFGTLPAHHSRFRCALVISEERKRAHHVQLYHSMAQVICGIPAVQCSAVRAGHRVLRNLGSCPRIHKCVPATRRHLDGEGTLCTMVGGRDHHVVFQSALIMVKRVFHHVKCMACFMRQETLLQSVWNRSCSRRSTSAS